MVSVLASRPSSDQGSTLHTIHEEVEILLATSCYMKHATETEISSGLVGHIGPYADFTFLPFTSCYTNQR